MELLEYVRRKAMARSGGAGALFNLSLSLPMGAVFGDEKILCARPVPLDDSDEIVSKELFPSSSDDDTEGSPGDDASTGARNPFFVVDLDPSENRPFAFGADATRLKKREAEDPTDLGLRGGFCRERDGVGGALKDVCDGAAV